VSISSITPRSIFPRVSILHHQLHFTAETRKSPDFPGLFRQAEK